MSEKATENRLIQAQIIWRRFRQLDATVGLLAQRGAGQLVHAAAHQMAQRVAAKGVTSYSKITLASRTSVPTPTPKCNWPLALGTTMPSRRRGQE